MAIGLQTARELSAKELDQVSGGAFPPSLYGNLPGLPKPPAPKYNG